MSFTPSKKRGLTPSERLKFKPRRYQFRAIKFGLTRKGAGFFLAPGLGKTAIIYSIFRILKRLGVVDELLVVAKRRIVYHVWPAENAKWRFNNRISVVHGPKKAAALEAKADVRLINYDGLAWLVKQKTFLNRKKRVMLALDESSKIKHTNTLRFRSLRKLLPFFSRVYIMTGSPAANSLMNLFGQVFAIDCGKTFGKYITQFRNEYFYPSGFMGHDWKLAPGSKKRIYRKLKPLVIRYGNDELKLPPITYIDRWVELPSKARDAYNELEEEYILRYRAGDIVAANAAVKTNKLRQVANGGVYYSEVNDQTKQSETRKYRTVHDAKIESLADLVEELQGEPALCSYEFGHDKLRLLDYFRRNLTECKDAPFIGGKSKDKDVSRYLRNWDRGKYPLMFGHPTSVAHGLNLQEGRGGIVVFYSVPWSLEDYEQFVQRVWRQGQRRRVLVYRILARDTVDEDVIASLAKNDRRQGSLLKAMERRHGLSKANRKRKENTTL